MTRRRSERVRDLGEVQRLFEEWRRARRGRARIPDKLWSAAVEVARRGGVNRTAAALRLDGGKLMKQLRTADAAAKKPKPTPPAFVELIAPRAGHAAEYVVEIDSGDDAGLRINCKGVSAADLAALCRALWSRGA
jgi:hypothetical protein